MKRPEIIRKIQHAMHSITPKVQTILYGSEARGDARPDSDIDLLILVDDDELPLTTEEHIRKPLCDIELETGILINARILLRKTWENRPFKTPYYINVTTEGIPL